MCLWAPTTYAQSLFPSSKITFSHRRSNVYERVYPTHRNKSQVLGGIHFLCDYFLSFWLQVQNFIV